MAASKIVNLDGDGGKKRKGNGGDAGQEQHQP
jgi:hypothetical protein